MKKINSFIFENIDKSLHLKTRIHSLKKYTSQNNSYVKREDELSSGIAGSKMRKYASFLSFVLQNKYQEVVIIGGEYSNNVMGILQILNERDIAVKLFLLQTKRCHFSGNSLWMRLLCADSDIVWVERKNWANVNTLAQEYTLKQQHKAFVVPEGVDHFCALPGGMTLAQDIIRNEKENDLYFTNIYCDSGTGLSSIAMILYFLAIRQNRFFHITLIAGSEIEYLQKLKRYARSIEKITELQIDTSLCHLRFYSPITASSFGSVNTSVLKECQRLAKAVGILADPVYSLKHFMTVKTIIGNEESLVIYNGGSFALAGFQEKLNRIMQQEYRT